MRFGQGRGSRDEPLAGRAVGESPRPRPSLRLVRSAAAKHAAAGACPRKKDRAGLARRAVENLGGNGLATGVQPVAIFPL